MFLIPSLTIFILGGWYILHQHQSSDLLANWIERWTDVLLRHLRAHASAQRASQAMYKVEYARRYNIHLAKEHQQAFWEQIASHLWEDSNAS